MDRFNPLTRLVVSLCIVAALLCGCGSAASRKAGYIAHGQQYFAAGRYDKARVEFSNAAQIDPKDAQVRYLLGQVAEKLGDVRAAVGEYRSAVASDPKLSSARAALARLYVYAGVADKAMELVEPGLAEDPKNPQLLTARGAARRVLGDTKGAMQDAQTAVALAPNDDYAVALLASLYRTDSQPEQAIAVVQKGLQQSPNNVDLLVILSDLYVQAHRPADAEATLRQIVALAPAQLEQRYRLARFYLVQKNVDGAERTLRDAVTAVPSDVGAKVQLVEFLLAQRGRDKAVAQVDLLIKQEPQNDELRNILGQFLAQAGMTDEAKTQFQTVIAHADLKPQGLEARDRLAALLLRTQDRKGASALLGQVLKENPRDNSALILRSDISMDNDDVADAIIDLRAVLRDQPNAVPVMRALAQAYVRNGESDQAEETLRTAAQLAPKDIDSRLLLAQLLLSANKLDQAGPMLEQLAKESPMNLSVAESLFRAQAARKQIAEARATAQGIEKVRPNVPLGYFLAGLVDEADNQLDDAQSDYQQALKLDPNASDPLTSLMHLYVRRNELAEAMRVVEATIARSPRNGVARALRGTLLESEGQLESAIGAYQEAVAAAPNWGPGYHLLAQAQLKAKHTDDAIRSLQQGIDKTSGAASLTGDLATLYEQAGRPDDAIALYQGILAKAPSSVFAANNLAVLLVKYKSDTASLSLAQKLADQLTGSSLANIIDTRGWVKFRSGDYHGAESLLQEAVDKSPDTPLMRYHLAMAQLRSGEPQVARQNLEAALRDAKSFDGIDTARATLAQLQKTPSAG